MVMLEFLSDCLIFDNNVFLFVRTEIYQTERNHVRTLKLLVGIFLIPLQSSGALNAEHLSLLFPPALLNLKDHHSLFEQQLKQRRIEHDSVVTTIGDLLLAMFDGRSGEDLKEHAAHFCARQQIALEALKEKRRKDESLHRLLTKAEAHKACRRLQLKDLLPTALQRLTKYPLLFESLYSITVKVDPDNDTEALAIRKALDLSKRILDHVNQAVRIAEDAHKLQTIQKKLDKSSYDKEASNEFKVRVGFGLMYVFIIAFFNESNLNIERLNTSNYYSIALTK